MSDPLFDADDRPHGPSSRWWQLVAGVVCMTMIANLQYGWTLFVEPLDAKYHWGRTAIQMAFTIFVLTETWLIPIEGYLVDRPGPSPVVMAGGILCGIAWALELGCRLADAPVSRGRTRAASEQRGLWHVRRERP